MREVPSKGSEAMLVLYPLGPPLLPDDFYAAEAAADRLGIPWGLIDHTALVRGDIDGALRLVPVRPKAVTGVYRGWMMTAGQYGRFTRPWRPAGSAL